MPNIIRIEYRPTNISLWDWQVWFYYDKGTPTYKTYSMTTETGLVNALKMFHGQKVIIEKCKWAINQELANIWGGKLRGKE